MNKQERDEMRELYAQSSGGTSYCYINHAGDTDFLNRIYHDIIPLLDTLDKMESDRDAYKSRCEELEDDVVAYQSDLARVEYRHETFLKHLIDTYCCPPTKTAETCEGGECRYCWCKWAENEARFVETGGDSGE